MTRARCSRCSTVHDPGEPPCPPARPAKDRTALRERLRQQMKHGPVRHGALLDTGLFGSTHELEMLLREMGAEVLSTSTREGGRLWSLPDGKSA